MTDPPLAQPLYWRAVPGSEPSPERLAPSLRGMRQVRADSDEAVRLLTILISGLISQQMTNGPAAGYETGVYTRRTDDALDMLTAHYDPGDRCNLWAMTGSLARRSLPLAVYELVADVARMPQFSPDVESCDRLDGEPRVRPAAPASRPPTKGPRGRWTNRPVATAASPGPATFASPAAKRAGTVEWGYRFGPRGQRHPGPGPTR